MYAVDGGYEHHNLLWSVKLPDAIENLATMADCTSPTYAATSASLHAIDQGQEIWHVKHHSGKSSDSLREWSQKRHPVSTPPHPLWRDPIYSRGGTMKGKGNHTKRKREREKEREPYIKNTLSKRKP